MSPTQVSAVIGFSVRKRWILPGSTGSVLLAIAASLVTGQAQFTAQPAPAITLTSPYPALSFSPLPGGVHGKVSAPPVVVLRVPDMHLRVADAVKGALSNNAAAKRLYSATPFAGLVLVPDKTDSAIVHTPGDQFKFAMPVHKPPLQLDPENK